ncbi:MULTISPECIES: hypothetical protein [unclassified Brucella]|uniref:hypothetical protein n=1 Tax=unclassified Brucella TaxID=2632610 RepID=UPI001294E635|nr:MULTISPECIES: hypothetical protein [unclassified Brucella]QGA58790.1 hypothetical protein GHC20_17440 [Brucella sp. 2280]QPN28509.1 hypothetical protein I5770_15345 [Brucella sp. BO2]
MTTLWVQQALVHYQFGGVDRRPLGPGQQHVGTTPDEFATVLDAAEALTFCDGLVRDGKHLGHERIVANYLACIERLQERM